MNEREELFDALACEIGKRPPDAPSFGNLARWLRNVIRRDGALEVTYDDAAGEAVEALAAAERRCCPEIGWEVVHEPSPLLTIRATASRLDALEAMLALGAES